MTEKSDNGCLLIHFAGFKNGDHLKAFESLLKKYPEGAKATNNYGRLPLHSAALHENFPVAELLLECYPEGTTVRDTTGRLAIDYVGEDQEIHKIFVNARKKRENHDKQQEDMKQKKERCEENLAKPKRLESYPKSSKRATT